MGESITMRILRCYQIFAGLLLIAVPAIAAPKSSTAKGHAHSIVRRAGASGKKSSRAASHQAAGIPAERATEIQSALIKQGYLSGEPTGAWDSQTVSAMEKLQADNGWQSKITPDSRALIKLGLGPDQPHESVQAPPR
jgi:hypothetical protein